MRNIVILNSLHFSYPLPILMRVSYNTLIVKQNTSDYYKYTKNNRPPQLYSEGNDRRTRQSRSAGAGKFRTSAPSATQLPCNMPCGVLLRSATKTGAGLFPQEKDPAPT